MIKLFLQSLWFNVTFYGANLVISVVLLPALLLPRKTLVKSIRLWLSAVAWVEGHLGGIRYEVRGRDRIPQGPILIASKHQSEWETFKTHVLFDDPAVVLKKELLNIPLIGLYMRCSGAIPIDRGGRMKALTSMVARAKAAVSEGRPVLIFPEGTRVAVGKTRPYKSGVAALYSALNVPLVPMALNSGLLWSKNSFFKKRGTVTIEFLPAIEPGLPRDDMMIRLKTALDGATERLIAEGRLKNPE
ncbi:MAG: lysophospholipid acyltransferase family protein [Alphaproteobacteria bacterium]|nr:lysophospholipid acyltransferase family protein [Alphaproteobacteria bacterium]